MNITVIGAGAIGSLYGAKLSKINDVILVGRKEHVEMINKKGLQIAGLENQNHKIKAATKVEKIEKGTLILLATKAQDSGEAIKPIKKLIRNDTIILCVQNGLYTENIVKKILGNECLVLRAVTNFGAIFLKPGTIKYAVASYTSIEKSETSREIAENFSKCGLNAHVSDDIKKDMWKKLIFNCMLNPTTAILKVENKAITDERLNPLKRLIAGECLRVAEKDGINFGFDFVEACNREFKNSTNRSSMQQDLLKGRKTEIDFLNGAVAELGKKLGIECPANEAIVNVIKFLEAGNK